MYVLFGFPLESPIAAKRADNGTIRLEFGLQGHLSLTDNEAAALVDQLTAALDEAPQ